MTHISDSLIVANPLQPSGFTYTLASRLGQMLDLAEARYGPRDPNFTVLGVEFRNGVPQIWLPNSANRVIVQIGTCALNDATRALFQLAHESVHLLDPAGGTTNVLEEGAAVRFQLDYVRDQCNAPDYQTGDPQYDRACELTDQLLAQSPNAVRDLRADFGGFRNITADGISQRFPSLSGIADTLILPFDQLGGATS